MELAGSAVEDKENASRASVRGSFETFPLHTFSAEGVEVHFVFNVSRIVRGLRASGIQYVLKV